MKKPPAQISFARSLRRTQTRPEWLLWNQLSGKKIDGVKFRRQQPLGPYVADFVCLEKKLVIELDGGQHGQPDAKRRDEQREEWLQKEGFRVLRFWNNEVTENLEGVVESIRAACNGLTLS